MAEIERFVDPLDKKHPRFPEAADKVSLRFLPRAIQAEGKTTTVEKTIGEAVEEGTVDNETLGYFLARIHLFLKELVIESEKVRFRQHMPNETAHCAADCWDAELLAPYEWIECAACSQRNPRASKGLEGMDIDVDMKWLGPKFRKDDKKIENAVARISQEDRERLAALQEAGGKVLVEVEGPGSLDLEQVTIAKNEKSVNVREYTPNFIEPSFGIGRILYSLIEHIYNREAQAEWCQRSLVIYQDLQPREAKLQWDL
ncbi:hypothetical protein B9Z19DRAFT_1154796 [Tuber borchii]|uniref:Uncharacterized protein n=1 Tax=Tuber borchii TaxID=42251 RepID=A0A2T6ZI75_TUBBO|nr:hypothetical protein B9Z19DRAFT_1154796 [Tuber borchii]